VDLPWVERLQQLVEQYPTFTYRHLWALVRGQAERSVNKKAVYRVLEAEAVVGPSAVVYASITHPRLGKPDQSKQ